MPPVLMTRPNGPAVRELREGLGWTQERLARKIRRTRKAISKVETGQDVSVTLMNQIAGALKVKPAAITLPMPARPAKPREHAGAT